MTTQPDDAWKQYYDLLDAFTKEWDVRPDLRVTALACDRTVCFSLAYPRDGQELVRRWHRTTRNVGTMRELAHALLDACDYVENANPVWASRSPA